MKKQNLIWLAVGAAAVYFLFLRKPAASAPTSQPTLEPTPIPTPTPTPTPTTTPTSDVVNGGISGMKPPSIWTNDELIKYHNKYLCYGMRGYNEPRIAMTAVRNYTNNAVAQEIAKRKLTPPPCANNLNRRY